VRTVIFTFLSAATFLLASFAIVDPALAGSATWSANPISSNWATNANWTPMTPPIFPGDTATFRTSSQTSVSLADAIEIDGIVFAPGANQFTITRPNGLTSLTISGAGITNNSGVLQTFVSNGPMSLTNGATAGNLVTFQGGVITFAGSANAGSATFDNPGDITFNDSTSAASANITLPDNSQGVVTFSDFSTAADAHITVMGEVFGQSERIVFTDNSTAGNSTITATATYYVAISFLGNSSAGTATLNASDSAIVLDENSTGEMSRVVLGNDINSGLDISGHAAPGVSVGSIEGYGNIALGINTLTVGANNVSTTYSGQISDRFAGTLVKTGTGTLTLTNSNTIRAGTRIENGTLRASHDGAFGGVPVSVTLNYVNVAPGATLTLDSGATNDYIADVASLIVATGSTVNLNFTGNPDRVRSFILDGVTQPPGIYGGPLSGAPKQIPQLNGSGTIFAVAKAVSRKVHGDAGAFDIDLPFAGGPGIECRDGNGDYQIVVTFANNVTFSYVGFIFGTGYVSSYNGSGTSTVTANLAGVANAQIIYVIIEDLNDGSGPTNWVLPMGILIGDVNGNGTVNASDVVAVKTQLGQPATASNFRADVNPNGIVNASDVVKVKTLLGTSLP
jgi:autotransporter-associated beta strand protein